MSGTRIDRRYIGRYFMVAGPAYTHKIVRLARSGTNHVVENLDTNELAFLSDHLVPPFNVVSVPGLGNCFTACRTLSGETVTCQVTDEGLLEILDVHHIWQPFFDKGRAKLYIPTAG